MELFWGGLSTIPDISSTIVVSSCIQYIDSPTVLISPNNCWLVRFVNTICPGASRANSLFPYSKSNENISKKPGSEYWI